MYHSIPGALKASLTSRDADGAALLASGPPRRGATPIVSRRSRVTTECHLSAVLDEILDDEDFAQIDHDFDLISLLNGIVEEEDDKQEQQQQPEQ